MTKPRGGLTELEGAILGVLRQSGGCTAYAVRQVFLASHSAEWSGSAGAVYPAIARLRKAGLLSERAKDDGRGTKTCVLTAKGRAVHDTWLCDVSRAVGPGMDPFRLRAGLWPELPPAQRRALLQTLRKELARIHKTVTQGLPKQDRHDAIADRLHLALLESRMHWLEGQD